MSPWLGYCCIRRHWSRSMQCPCWILLSGANMSCFLCSLGQHTFVHEACLLPAHDLHAIQLRTANTDDFDAMSAESASSSMRCWYLQERNQQRQSLSGGSHVVKYQAEWQMSHTPGSSGVSAWRLIVWLRLHVLARCLFFGIRPREHGCLSDVVAQAAHP